MSCLLYCSTMGYRKLSAQYNNSKSAVMIDGNISDPFEVSTGVLQDDILAPYLFIISVDFLMKTSTSGSDSGVVTHPRRSGRYSAKVLKDLDLLMTLSCWNPPSPEHRYSWPVQLQSKISWPYNQYSQDST